jgi:hypothetical protein
VTRPGRVVQAIVWLQSGGEKADLTLGLDALGLGLLGLGHQDAQHAVLERGLDLVSLDMGGQGDRAAEGAGAALDPVEVLVGCVVGGVPLTLDGQQAAPAGCPTYSRSSALHLARNHPSEGAAAPGSQAGRRP